MDSSILAYGELVIGIGTFVLAIVVAVYTYISIKKDRKVHLADKQQNWLFEFRRIIAELISTQYLMSTLKMDKLNEASLKQLSIEERDEISKGLMKIRFLSSQIVLMFNDNDMREKIKRSINLCTDSLFISDIDERMDKVIENQNLLLDDIDKINIRTTKEHKEFKNKGYSNLKKLLI